MHDDRRVLLAGLPVQERRLRLAAVSTAVLEGGDGPPVVLRAALASVPAPARPRRVATSIEVHS
ncbi:MAG TPA: hypothetical protein VF978_07295 [Gemmatimonadales bacterium]